MTARPDEVVAWRWKFHGDSDWNVTVRKPTGDSAEPLVPLAALQSANARLAEANERGDAWRAKFDADTALIKAATNTSNYWIAEGAKLEKRLADVMSLADQWEVINPRDHKDDYGDLNELGSVRLVMAAELRRAAAGEGDANQGDTK